MPEGPSEKEIGRSLATLLNSGELSSSDEMIAEQCLRRLSQPLRLIILGNAVRHAVSLLNLISGQALGYPSQDRTRIQLLFGRKPFAVVEYSDGTAEEFAQEEIDEIHSDNPARIKIGADSAVLERVSLMAAADINTEALCAEVERTLLASDIAIFVGGDLTRPIQSLWSRLPDHLKHHSYLALSPETDPDRWAAIDEEFADVLTVDPVKAQLAKTRDGGPDKEAFRATGGAAVVKALKRELEVLKQSSIDTANLLLVRYGADGLSDTMSGDRDEAITSAPQEGSDKTQPRQPDERQPTYRSDREPDAAAGEKAPVASAASEGEPQKTGRADSPGPTERPGKSEDQDTARVTLTERQAQPNEADADPKTTPSSVKPKKVRPSSRKRPRPSATPWSLDL